MSLRLRRPADRPRLHHHDHARRPDRPHRTERLGQDHAAAAAAGRADAATPARCARAPTCEIAYFDQLRDQLDGAHRLRQHRRRQRHRRRSTADSRHVLGYLQDFLFSPERARTPGQRALRRRAEPAAAGPAVHPSRPTCWCWTNRPTTSTLETLDLLEELLVDYSGHGAAGQPRPRVSRQRRHQHAGARRDGRVGEYVGGYSDWLRQRRRTRTRAAEACDQRPQRLTPAAAKPARKRRLTSKESDELAGLPDRIDALEGERRGLFAAFADPALRRCTRSGRYESAPHNS